MTTQTSTIQLRIDSKTKAKAQSILKNLGMDLSSAMKLFLTQVIRTKSIPFIARTTNGHTPEFEKMILDEWKSMKAGNEVTFSSTEDALKYLNS